jgi:DNA-binding HxlR family transcriptional regulator
VYRTSIADRTSLAAWNCSVIRALELTGKGRALFPAIAALRAWGSQQAPGPAGQ